jgi:hypothetical protein
VLTITAILTAAVVAVLVARLTSAMALRAFRAFVRNLWPH